MNPFSPEATERLRRAFAASGVSLPPCPEVEDIFAAARGELDVASIRRLVDHTAACGSCAEAWRLAWAFTEHEPQTSEMIPPVRSRTFVSRRWTLLAAAAAVVLVTSVGLVRVFWSTSLPEPEYRDVLERSITALPETAQLPRGACRLRWSPAPTGARYTVRVASENLSAIARATDLEVPEYLVPADALAQVPSGGRIVWQIDATLPDGRAIASPTFVTIIK